MTEVCAEFAASFMPREGSWFPCALPKGHEGPHRTGGTCFVHGPYVCDKPGYPQGCPKYPECITEKMKGSPNNGQN